jgi:hypothetical protein
MISNYRCTLFFLFSLFILISCNKNQVLTNSVITANELIGKSYHANDFRQNTSLVKGYYDAGGTLLSFNKAQDYAYTHLTDTVNKKDIIIFERELSREENNIHWQIIDILEIKDLPKNQQLNRSCTYKLDNENEQCVAISGIEADKSNNFRVFNVWIFDMKNKKIIRGDIEKCECFYEEVD